MKRPPASDARVAFAPVSDPPDEFMTVAEVASILKLNQQTVRNDAGKLPALERPAGSLAAW